MVFNFKILKLGTVPTQFAFELHLSFQKLREKPSSQLKSALNGLKAFQKPLESPFISLFKKFGQKSNKCISQ